MPLLEREFGEYSDLTSVERLVERHLGYLPVK